VFDMARLQLTQLQLECPCCKGRYLEGPEYPCSDTKMTFAPCGNRQTFLDLERAAIAKMQALMHSIGVQRPGSFSKRRPNGAHEISATNAEIADRS